MRHRGRRFAAASVLAAATLGGCVLVTGSTDGYVESADAAAAATPTASACDADASVCLVLACSSAADCDDADSGAPGYCCLTTTVSPAGASLSCQSTPCTQNQSAVCLNTSDCAADLDCETHACTLGGTSTTFQTCGSFTCPVSF